MKKTFLHRSTQPWTPEEFAVFKNFDDSADIQAFLDDMPYSDDPIYRSPRSVLRDRKAHCFDGALFAAAALRFLGYVPRVCEIKAVRDDVHLLALFNIDGHFGAIAKSNFSGLRFREPVFRNLRELVLSYFEDYYNVDGEKTMRGYTIPLDLSRYDSLHWMTEDQGLDVIAEKLDQIRSISLLTPEMEARLHRMDNRSYQAGLLGVNEAGLYRPEEHH